MFGLSPWEILVILVVALLFIGPDQLPSVARKLGRGMQQVRGAMTRVDQEVRRTIREATAEEAEKEDALRRVEAEGATPEPLPPEPATNHPEDPPAHATPARPRPLTHNADPDRVAASDGDTFKIPPRKAPSGAVSRKAPSPPEAPTTPEPTEAPE